MKISDVLKNDKKCHFEYGSKGHALLAHYYGAAFIQMKVQREDVVCASVRMVRQ